MTDTSAVPAPTGLEAPFQPSAAEEGIAALEVDPSGAYVAAASRRGPVRLWRTSGDAGPDEEPEETPEPAAAWSVEAPPATVAWSRDGSMLVAGDKSGHLQVLIADVETPPPPVTVSAAALRMIAWTPAEPEGGDAGYGIGWLVGDDAGGLALWELPPHASDKGRQRWRVEAAHEGVAVRAAVAPDNQHVATLGTDQTLAIWSLDDGSLRARIALPTDRSTHFPLQIRWRDDFRHVVVQMSSWVGVIDVRTKDIVQVVDLPRWGSGLSPMDRHGKRVVVPVPRGFAQIDVDTGKQAAILPMDDTPRTVESLAATADLRRVAAGLPDGRVLVLDFVDLGVVGTWEGIGAAAGLAALPDGRFVCGRDDGTVEIVGLPLDL